MIVDVVGESTEIRGWIDQQARFVRVGLNKIQTERYAVSVCRQFPFGLKINTALSISGVE
jgi:hypothetical protein